MKSIRITFILTLIAFALQTNAQSVSKRRIEDHIMYLADDDLKGRRTGSEGELKAAQYIAAQFQKIGLEQKGNNGYLDAITVNNKKKNTKVEHPTERIKTQNVIGFIDNHATNTVVIGAHYDHLGLGHDGNSREANADDKIHNGADDNASGVAGLIELARLLKKNRIDEKNNYLFVAFTAEELGLLGSKKFCEKPSVDLKSINYMINMDMIGRLNNEKKLMITGVGTSNVWTSTIYSVNEEYFSLKLDSSGIGPSDHTSFYLKDIPALHFCTGQHKDYHKASDDIEKINLLGTKYIIEFIYDLVIETDEAEKIAFYKTKTKAREGKRKYKVTMGIMPDYTADVSGLRIDGVTEERPADKAGLQSGDIITKVDDIIVNDIYDYMKVLGQYKVGDVATVYFLRGNEKMEANLTF